MHSFRDNTVLLQAAYAVIVISPPRALYAILYDWFWKSDNDFLIAFHGNFVSAMHGFRDNKIVLPTGYDVIVSPPPGGAPSAFSGRITCSAVPYGNMETSTHHSSETSPNKTIKFCTFDDVGETNTITKFGWNSPARDSSTQAWNLCKKIENFILCVNDNDTTKTANRKIIVLPAGTFSLELVLLLCST